LKLNLITIVVTVYILIFVPQRKKIALIKKRCCGYYFNNFFRELVLQKKNQLEQCIHSFYYSVFREIEHVHSESNVLQQDLFFSH